MSYDVFDFNHTFNQSPLFAVLFDDIHSDVLVYDKPASGLHKLNGMRGKQACDVIQHALAKAQSMPNLADYDSANGWGTAASALAFLGQIACYCGQHRKAVIYIRA